MICHRQAGQRPAAGRAAMSGHGAGFVGTFPRWASEEGDRKQAGDKDKGRTASNVQNQREVAMRELPAGFL